MICLYIYIYTFSLINRWMETKICYRLRPMLLSETRTFRLGTGGNRPSTGAQTFLHLGNPPYFLSPNPITRIFNIVRILFYFFNFYFLLLS